MWRRDTFYNLSYSFYHSASNQFCQLYVLDSCLVQEPAWYQSQSSSQVRTVCLAVRHCLGLTNTFQCDIKLISLFVRASN